MNRNTHQPTDSPYGTTSATADTVDAIGGRDDQQPTSCVAAMFDVSITHPDALPYDPDRLLRAASEHLVDDPHRRTAVELAHFASKELGVHFPLDAIVRADHLARRQAHVVDIMVLCLLIDAHSVWFHERRGTWAAKQHAAALRARDVAESASATARTVARRAVATAGRLAERAKNITSDNGQSLRTRVGNWLS